MANQLVQRNHGVTVWFGGKTNSDTDGIIYNDFSVTAAGVVAGADLSLSDEFQLGAYVIMEKLILITTEKPEVVGIQRVLVEV